MSGSLPMGEEGYLPFCLKHSAHERAINAHDERLDKHSESLDTMQDCLARLVVLQEHTEKWQEQADKRLHELESAPATRWNTVVTTAVTSVVSALVGAGIASIGINIAAG